MTSLPWVFLFGYLKTSPSWGEVPFLCSKSLVYQGLGLMQNAQDIKNDIHKLLLEHANTSLVKIDFLKNEFIVQPHIHNKKLLLKISMQKFLDHFGWLLFGITLKNKPRINLYNIFYLGSCYDDETKLTILRDIKQMLSKSKYTLIYEDEDDYYFANNEIDVADLNSNLRNTVQLNNFVESFKMVPYQIGKNSVNDVVSYISDLKSKWQTPSDVKALRKESQRLAN